MQPFNTTTTDPKFTAMLETVIQATNARNEEQEYDKLFGIATHLGLEIGMYARVGIDEGKVRNITLGYLTCDNKGLKFDETVTLRFSSWPGNSRPEINWYAMGDQSDMGRVAMFAKMITLLTELAQANG